MEQYCTQFAVLILCNDYTACDEMGDCFATEADTMIKNTIVVNMCISHVICFDWSIYVGEGRK